MKKFVELAECIAIKIRKINVLKAILILIGVYLILESTTVIAQAGMMDAIGAPDVFQNLGGDAKYLSAGYRSNYYLDTQKLGLTDVYCKAVKFISNLMWSAVVTLTYLAILAFHFAFSMDLANMFSGTMEAILGALKISIFDKYWLFIVAIAFIFVLTAFFKSNISEVFSRVSYMVIAFCLAGILVKYATPIVSTMTTMSKGIGASSVVSISSGGAVENDVTAQADREIAKISGQLWVNLVHKPYLDLEGDNKLSNQQVEKILSLDPKSDERQNYIDEINKSDETLFEDTAGEDRIFPAFIILVVNLVKMIILFLISLLQIAFQIFTIVLIFGLPFILLLSIVPAFGGIGLVQVTGKQILSTQIGIILTSLLLGIIIQIDFLVGELFKGSTQYGWFFASFMQSMLFFVIIWQRKQIFTILASIQRKFSTAGTGVWYGARRHADNMVKNGSEKLSSAKEGISDKASDLRNWTGDKAAKGAHIAAAGILAADGAIRNHIKKRQGGEVGKKEGAGEEESKADNKPKRRVTFMDQDQPTKNSEAKKDMREKAVEKDQEITKKKPEKKMNLNNRVESNKKVREKLEKELIDKENLDENIISRSELELARERMAKGESLDSIYKDADTNDENKENFIEKDYDNDLLTQEGTTVLIDHPKEVEKINNLDKKEKSGKSRENNRNPVEKKELKGKINGIEKKELKGTVDRIDNKEVAKDLNMAQREERPKKISNIERKEDKEKNIKTKEVPEIQNINNQKALNERVKDRHGDRKNISQEERASMFSKKIKK